MLVKLSYPTRYNFDLAVPTPISQSMLRQHNQRLDVYRIHPSSIDTMLSRVYTHNSHSNVKREHVHSDHLWVYADVEIVASKRRAYTLTLCVCAARGYLTRRQYYVRHGHCIERTDTGLWVAYTDSLDVITSLSLFDLVRSL